ncbi:MAG: AAA family ATPase [Hydrogenobaculum sp.]
MDKILSLEIVNFKTFKHLKIDDLGKNINFIYGKNNVGKTSILEAIVLLLSYSVVQNMKTPNDVLNAFSTVLRSQFYGNRLLPFKSLWNSIFKNPDEEIRIEALLSNNDRLSLQIKPFDKYSSFSEIALEWKYSKDDKDEQAFSIAISEPRMETYSSTIPIPFLLNPMLPLLKPLKGKIDKQFNIVVMSHILLYNANIMNGIYAKIVISNKKREFIDKLKTIEPDIEDLEHIPDEFGTIFVKKKNGTLVPIHQIGEGFLKMFHIIGSSFIGNGDTIVLIDEIENGLHYSVQEQIFDNILKSSRDFNIQYFITTHNYEFVERGIRNLENEYIEYIHSIRVIEKFDAKTSDYIINVLPIEGMKLKKLVEIEAEFR